MPVSTYPFALPPLGYAFTALEPYIGAQTVQLHYEKHFGGYAASLNRALEPHPALQNRSAERLLTAPLPLPAEQRRQIRTAAGGYYAHALYFSTLASAGGPGPTGPLGAAIVEAFGSREGLAREFRTQGTALLGSGWVWLLCDKNGRLSLAGAPNVDVPLGGGRTPILALDVWEHAYYLDVHNRRAEYIDNWLRLIDWPAVNTNYLNCVRHKVRVFRTRQV